MTDDTCTCGHSAEDHDYQLGLCNICQCMRYLTAEDLEEEEAENEIEPLDFDNHGDAA